MVRTTIPFMERRRFQRQPIDGPAWALSSDLSIHPALTNLALCDLSDGGLAAVSPVALPITRPVLVTLPQPTLHGLPGQVHPGRIVRCRKFPGGFQVAVAFDQPPTAAS